MPTNLKSKEATHGSRLQRLVNLMQARFRKLPVNGSVDWEDEDEVQAYGLARAKYRAAKRNVEAGEFAYKAYGLRIEARKFFGLESPFCDSERVA